ncbi:MAG: MarR family transcriptional regulator [Microbacteriaceae bacterium]
MTRSDAGSDELRILIQKLSRRIRANRAGDGITDGQLSVLVHLDKNGARSPGQIADHEHVTPPSMNRTINALEDAGLVTRTPSTDDGRKVLIDLTDTGREIISETRRLRTAWFTQLLAELSPAERRALEEVTPILRRLADS